MSDIFSFLKEHNIPYENFEHAPVFTVEESSKLPEMPGAPTKNLFLRDKNAKRHFLVTVPHEKRVDLKKLEKILCVTKLSFASAEDLKKYLGVEPGSVTVLGLMNDKTAKAEMIFDESLWKANSLQCHPLRNTATSVLSLDAIVTFLEATNHMWSVIDLPVRN